MRYRHRLRQLVLLCLMGALGNPLPVLAEMPTELRGKWSSHPGRCEPVGGEVDVLTISATDLSFYEIGCKLGRSTRSGTSLTLDAQCFKGGSPVRSGKVVLRQHAANEIDLVLQGFSWIAVKPQRYRRC
ncbi:hypothetical protein [Bosea sp. (in: a-proteobacteria)]|uniref:hypothetical protein n=1 Tax=Bosea sp. (in: a-proteobacteria) TaxID=1871050 RepID=UPI002DDD5B09|nr:hypothetical protein [Bosea sp. (in: a-proteobacteria)]HEV2512917.1 hypothetical protein [Bosea sp. (in: a-proteobacteria)]